MQNYWARLLNERLTRRRALVASGAGAAAIAFTVACGGGDSGGGEKKDASGLLTKPVDTTAKAKRGGVMFLSRNTNPGDFDPLAGQGSMTSGHTATVYSRLISHKVGKYPEPVDGSLEPDAATSWELSPDASQITLKLRGMPFDQRAPTNGRAMNANDVKFSWDKFAAKQGLRGELANSVSPDSPIVGVQTPDAKTVVFKLAYPYAPIPELLAWHNYIQIEPVEAEGGFDPRTDMRGSGAWLMEEYRPSQVMRLRRNPQWYEKDRPYLDGVDWVIIPEYATALAQLRAGNLWEFVNLSPEDVIPTKRAVPQLQMLQKSSFGDRTMPDQVGLGYLPGSPFFDERIRWAISMLYDRDLWMKTFYNLDQFESEGLNVPTRWNTMITPGQEGYWIDPHDKAFGDAGKYFMHDPAEAKKLLQAATGNKLPLETEFTWTANGYGPVYAKQVEVMSGMLQDQNDFKFKMQVVDYQSVFRAGYSNAPGTFNGICLTSGRAAANIDLYLFGNFHSKGSKPKFPFKDEAGEALILKQRAELDATKRKQTALELLKYMSSKMYFVPFDGEALDFELKWPFMGNFGVHTSWATPWQEEYTYRWFDDSKKKA
jgi:peptide/nickel transport system substrate-binding protein